MDVCQLTRLFFGVAVRSSLVLLGSAAVLAGDRAHEQPTRPHTSAAYSPNWGFSQTSWNRFPAVADCPGTGFELSQDGFGYENYPSQQILYTPQNSMMPQNGMMPHERQLVSPGYGFSQSPISVYPDPAPAAGDKKSTGSAAGPPAGGNPPAPNSSTSPSSSMPAVPQALPPLPAPPLPAPGQSSFHPNMMFPNRSVSMSRSTLQTGARYGVTGRSTMPASSFAPVASGSYAQALISNTRSPSMAAAGSRYGTARPPHQMPAASQMPIAPPVYPENYGPAMNNNGHSMAQSPFSLVSQSRVLPSSAAPDSYRSGNAMRSASETARPLFHQTELPQTSIYQTIPSEPLRSTP